MSVTHASFHRRASGGRPGRGVARLCSCVVFGVLLGIAGPASSGPAEHRAREFLSERADALGLRPDLSQLVALRERTDRGGSVVRYDQLHGGVRVFGGGVVVGMDTAGRVIYHRINEIPDLELATVPTLPAASATSIAQSLFGAPLARGFPPPELVVVRGDKTSPGYHLAWQVTAVVLRPRASWLIFVDAHSRRVVRRIDLLKRTGNACVPCDPSADFECGSLFFESPVDLLDDPLLADSDNVDSAQLPCELLGLTSSSFLDGSWVNTSLTSGRVGPPYTYLRSTNQRAIDELTVYYHADRAKRYLDALGFPGVMAFSIDTDAADSSAGDNSYYDPATKEMHFGEGGVDDGQDPDIVYHEYGHAIQDDQVPGFGYSGESGAMGEGFGDYWAVALTDDFSTPELGAACVGAWDATAYNPYEGGTPGTGCLRRVDHDRFYPRDLSYEVHDDGEIWSAVLWALRAVLGGVTTDALVIKSHTFLTETASFIDGADALLSADTALNGSANAAAIHDTMKTHGIPRTGTPASSTGLDQTTPFVCETNHNYSNYEYKECTFTQPGAERIRFHFQSFDTEAGYDFVWISDADYNQVQELSGQPFGAGGNGWSAAVAGDTIVARFMADYSVTDFGFVIDEVGFAEAQQIPGLPCWALVALASLLVAIISWRKVGITGAPAQRP